MKKRIRQFLIGTSFTLVALVGFLVLFIVYPNNLFAKRIAYREFTIYSDKEVSSNYKLILDNALALVQTSELYDSNYQFDIFLTEGTLSRQLSFKVLGPSLARSIDNNIMLNIHADFDANLLIGPKNKRDLTRTIAHEMIHCLQMQQYGFLRFNPLQHPPLWKLEGYPEYVAYAKEIRSPTYDFIETVKTLRKYEQEKAAWVALTPGHSDPVIYFKGRVLIEYLIDIRGMNYDQILSDAIDGDAVDRELSEWLAAQSGE